MSVFVKNLIEFHKKGNLNSITLDDVCFHLSYSKPTVLLHLKINLPEQCHYKTQMWKVYFYTSSCTSICFVFKKCQHNYFVYNPQSEYLIIETLSLSTSQYKQDMLTSKICKAKVKYVSIYSRYSVLLSAHSQKRNMIFIYIHYDGKVFNEDNTIFMGQVFLRKYCGIV